MHAAFDAGEIVGGAGAATFELSVPGGSLPCAGVTVVGVYPTHRRRGVMRELMRAQLDDAHARGEPLAALWASEETIYGRFGYGIASWAGEIELRRESGGFARPVERRGTVRFLEPDEAAHLLPPLWDTLRARRPGVFSRTPDWWKTRQLRTPEEEKAKPRRYAVVEVDGEVRAYAIYKVSPGFEAGVSTSILEVVEAIGVDPQATAELWRFLLDIDLVATVKVRLVPPDHPLFMLLANPRRARYRMGDGLWIRLVDAGAALSGRAYRGEGSVVIELRDEFCPWNSGRWRVGDGPAERTDEAAELALDVDALGAAYLGAISFAQLRDGLRVEERTPGAVSRADAIFGWRPLPWCPEIF
jgi:predicted acetyltransferase